MGGSMKEYKPEDLDNRALMYSGLGGAFIAYSSSFGTLAFVLAKFLGDKALNAPQALGLTAVFLFIIGLYLTFTSHSAMYLARELRKDGERRKKVEDLYGK